MRRIALLISMLGALGALLWPVSPALACSCVRSSIADNFAGADVVFVGLASSVEAPGSSTQGTAHFSVTDVFKGPVGSTAVVRTPEGTNTCSLDLVPGAFYAVFADAEDGEVRTDLCSGTTRDGDALRKAGLKSRRTFELTTPAPPTDREVAMTDNPGRAGTISAAALLLSSVVLATLLTRGRIGFRRGGAV